jgi:putative hydrolase of the HAD superfamily
MDASSRTIEKMIRAILFDCFGVLTSDKWKEFVGGLPESQREAARELNRAFDSGHLNKSDFSQAIQDLTGRQFSYVEDLLDNEITKNAALLDYIRQLHTEYKIGLVSNIASNWIRDSLLTPDEQKLFDSFTLSYEVGMTKPDPRIFELAAQQVGAAIEECLLIDDIERYCEAARDTGMQALVYRDTEQIKRELARALERS